MIPYGRQCLNESDCQAVLRVLRSDYLTTGPEVEAFERDFAHFVGAPHAVAVCNATAALHLCMLALDVGPGMRVLTSTQTFLASANAAAMAGAIPDFCDVEEDSFNLCPRSLQASWQDDVRAVVLVHFAGLPCRLVELAAFARSRGAWVIEDASHAVGSRFVWEGREWACGAHPWADLSVFSFHPVKTMTAAEGGMITTGNAALAARLRRLRHHGMERDVSSWVGLGTGSSDLDAKGPWYYEMQELGYNFRLSDVHAALGRSQLNRIESFISRRLELRAGYLEAFQDVPWIRTQNPPAWWKGSGRVSWHLFTMDLDFQLLGRSRPEVMERLRGAGVGSQVLYIPVHLQPWYQSRYGYGLGKCPVAEALYPRLLSIPMHAGMTDGDQRRVIEAVLSLAVA
jgi:dTDP-4-amino-4,6-dideoxygalactose transaminase